MATPRYTATPQPAGVGKVSVTPSSGSINMVTVGVGGFAGVQSFNGRAGVVVLTTADVAGNMPLATNSTAGAVIVGANLTVTNGTISAVIPPSDWANITGKPSLVNTFNTRSGDVTLQASDVTSITAGLYQPTFTNITTGSNLTVVNANGTANISVTGWTSNSTDSRGVGYLTLGLGEPTVGATYRDTVGGNVTGVGSLKVNYGGSLAYSGKASEPNGTTTMSGLASLSLFPARASTIAGGFPTAVYSVSASTNDGAGNQTSVLQQHRLRLNSTAGTYQTFQGKIQSNNGTFSGYDLTACVTPSNTSLTFTAASDKPIVWTANSLLIQSYADSRYQAAGSYLTAANLTFANITGTPTTLAGYGITDSITAATAAATYLPIANFTYANITGKPTLATVATSGLYSDLSGTPNLTIYAPLASPALTGNPTAPTQTAGTNNTTLATTAFVVTALGSYLPSANFTFANLTAKPTTVSGYGITDAATTGANTFTGTQALGGNLLTQPKLQSYRETSTAPTISAGTLTLDLSGSNFFAVSLNAAITTFTISNTPSSSAASFTLEFTADGTARAVAWPSSVKWAGGTAPTLTSTSGKKDVFAFYSNDGGTTWQGFTGGQNF